MEEIIGAIADVVEDESLDDSEKLDQIAEIINDETEELEEGDEE